MSNGDSSASTSDAILSITILACCLFSRQVPLLRTTRVNKIFDRALTSRSSPRIVLVHLADAFSAEHLHSAELADRNRLRGILLVLALRSTSECFGAPLILGVAAHRLVQAIAKTVGMKGNGARLR